MNLGSFTGVPDMTKKLNNRDSKEVRDFNKKVFDFFGKNSIDTKRSTNLEKYPSGLIDSFKPYMQNSGISFKACSSLSNKGSW